MLKVPFVNKVSEKKDLAIALAKFFSGFQTFGQRN